MRRFHAGTSRRSSEPVDTSGLSDADVLAASLREPKAFAMLFDRYWETIFRVCYFRLSDWHDAEDVAGQIFANAFASRARFQSGNPSQTVRAWLFGITRNVLGNTWRYAARHPSTSIEGAGQVADRTVSVEDQVIAGEEQEMLFTLMNGLPPDQRELLELRLAGLSAAEIGAVLGRSPEAIRKAQSRILIAMRSALSEDSRGSEMRHG